MKKIREMKKTIENEEHQENHLKRRKSQNMKNIKKIIENEENQEMKKHRQ